VFQLTFSSLGLAAGSVSTGLMHATPGEMKSFRSSAERMADIATPASARRTVDSSCRGPDGRDTKVVNQVCQGILF